MKEKNRNVVDRWQETSPQGNRDEINTRQSRGERLYRGRERRNRNMSGNEKITQERNIISEERRGSTYGNMSKDSRRPEWNRSNDRKSNDRHVSEEDSRCGRSTVRKVSKNRGSRDRNLCDDSRSQDRDISGDRRSFDGNLSGARSWDRSMSRDKRSWDRSMSRDRKSLDRSMTGDRRSWDRNMSGCKRSWDRSLSRDRKSLDRTWDRSMSGDRRSWDRNMPGCRRSWDRSMSRDRRSLDRNMSGDRKSWYSNMSGDRSTWDRSLSGDSRSLERNMCGDRSQDRNMFGDKRSSGINMFMDKGSQDRKLSKDKKYEYRNMSRDRRSPDRDIYRMRRSLYRGMSVNSRPQDRKLPDYSRSQNRDMSGNKRSIDRKLSEDRETLDRNRSRERRSQDRNLIEDGRRSRSSNMCLERKKSQDRNIISVDDRGRRDLNMSKDTNLQERNMSNVKRGSRGINVVEQDRGLRKRNMVVNRRSCVNNICKDKRNDNSKRWSPTPRSYYGRKKNYLPRKHILDSIRLCNQDMIVDKKYQDSSSRKRFNSDTEGGKVHSVWPCFLWNIGDCIESGNHVECMGVGLVEFQHYCVLCRSDTHGKVECEVEEETNVGRNVDCLEDGRRRSGHFGGNSHATRNDLKRSRGRLGKQITDLEGEKLQEEEHKHKRQKTKTDSDVKIQRNLSSTGDSMDEGNQKGSDKNQMLVKALAAKFEENFQDGKTWDESSDGSAGSVSSCDGKDGHQSTTSCNLSTDSSLDADTGEDLEYKSIGDDNAEELPMIEVSHGETINVLQSEDNSDKLENNEKVCEKVTNQSQSKEVGKYLMEEKQKEYCEGTDIVYTNEECDEALKETSQQNIIEETKQKLQSEDESLPNSTRSKLEVDADYENLEENEKVCENIPNESQSKEIGKYLSEEKQTEYCEETECDEVSKETSMLPINEMSHADESLTFPQSEWDSQLDCTTLRLDNVGDNSEKLEENEKVCEKVTDESQNEEVEKYLIENKQKNYYEATDVVLFLSEECDEESKETLMQNKIGETKQSSEKHEENEEVGEMFTDESQIKEAEKYLMEDKQKESFEGTDIVDMNVECDEATKESSRQNEIEETKQKLKEVRAQMEQSKKHVVRMQEERKVMLDKLLEEVMEQEEIMASLVTREIELVAQL